MTTVCVTSQSFIPVRSGFLSQTYRNLDGFLSGLIESSEKDAYRLQNTVRIANLEVAFSRYINVLTDKGSSFFAKCDSSSANWQVLRKLADVFSFVFCYLKDEGSSFFAGGLAGDYRKGMRRSHLGPSKGDLPANLTRRLPTFSVVLQCFNSKRFPTLRECRSLLDLSTTHLNSGLIDLMWTQNSWFRRFESLRKVPELRGEGKSDSSKGSLNYAEPNKASVKGSLNYATKMESSLNYAQKSFARWPRAVKNRQK